MRLSRRIVVAGLLTAACASAGAAQPQRGMSLTLWSEDLDTEQLAASLDNLARLGADCVSVNVWWFQDDVASTVISPDFSRYSAGDDAVRAAIDAAHARGMKVMLKPLVDLRGSGWRGQILGGSEWFSGAGGYGDFINHFADIAEAKGVELFCVGTELAATAGQEADWRAVVTGVRSRYAGPITYAAHRGAGGADVTNADIAWWDAVDYVGLDAYYPLTTKLDPTPAELQAAWSAQADAIETWRAGVAPGKPVLFTEVGYRSWDGTNRSPDDGGSKGDSNVDEAEQADCYEALLSRLWKTRDWLAGLYWWNWEVDPDPTWEADNWYPLQGKPAEAVLGAYYQSAPGDANGDDRVDVFDLAVLANHYGRSAGATWLLGDFTGDGGVDVFDLAVLANHYGHGADAAEPVPEPAGMLVLLVGAAAVVRRRPQRPPGHGGGRA